MIFYADLKILKRVNNYNDALLLQQNLARFEDWCAIDNLLIRQVKHQVIHFSRSKTVQTFNYMLNSVVLSEVDMIRDLGIYFALDLSFVHYIRTIVATAYRRLDLIYKTLKYFKNVNTLKILFLALVCLHVKYMDLYCRAQIRKIIRY